MYFFESFQFIPEDKIKKSADEGYALECFEMAYRSLHDKERNNEEKIKFCESYMKKGLTLALYQLSEVAINLTVLILLFEMYQVESKYQDQHFKKLKMLYEKLLFAELDKSEPNKRLNRYIKNQYIKLSEAIQKQVILHSLYFYNINLSLKTIYKLSKINLFLGNCYNAISRGTYSFKKDVKQLIFDAFLSHYNNKNFFSDEKKAYSFLNGFKEKSPFLLVENINCSEITLGYTYSLNQHFSWDGYLVSYSKYRIDDDKFKEELLGGIFKFSYQKNYRNMPSCISDFSLAKMLIYCYEQQLISYADFKRSSNMTAIPSSHDKLKNTLFKVKIVERPTKDPQKILQIADNLLTLYNSKQYPKSKYERDLKDFILQLVANKEQDDTFLLNAIKIYQRYCDRFDFSLNSTMKEKNIQEILINAAKTSTYILQLWQKYILSSFQKIEEWLAENTYESKEFLPLLQILRNKINIAPLEFYLPEDNMSLLPLTSYKQLQESINNDFCHLPNEVKDTTRDSLLLALEQIQNHWIDEPAELFKSRPISLLLMK